MLMTKEPYLFLMLFTMHSNSRGMCYQELASGENVITTPIYIALNCPFQVGREGGEGRAYKAVANL
jgi:hypothetical protein